MKPLSSPVERRPARKALAQPIRCGLAQILGASHQAQAAGAARLPGEPVQHLQELELIAEVVLEPEHV